MKKNLLQVSIDTLLGINWMGASRLVSVMEQTAIRGPFDKHTWNKFTSRADLIASTNGFRPIQVSRILLYMYLAKHRDDRLLTKLHSLIDDKFISSSDSGTLCGIIQGFKRLNYPPNKFKQILDSYKNKLLTLEFDNYFHYSLLLNAYTYPEYVDVILQLMNQHYKKFENLSLQELSLICNCITKISQYNTDFDRFIPILFENILNKSDSDLKSAVVLLNALSRSPKFSKIQYIDVLSSIITKNKDQLNIQQITMLLRSLRRLKYAPIELLDVMIPRLETMISEASPLQLASITSSLNSLNIKNKKLMESIISNVLSSFHNYNLSHLSQVTFSIFNHIPYNDFDLAAKLISKHVDENSNLLTLHDIVLFCLSLNKYWSSNIEFNNLELRLLDLANGFIASKSCELLPSDLETISQLYTKYKN